VTAAIGAGDPKMSHAHLAVYLGDHRAGAVAAVSLLDQLEQAHGDKPLGRFAKDLRAEILADVRELEGLMARLDIASSVIRNAAGWLTEKAAELKVGLDDPGDGALRLLETLEALALGIDGKRALWRALSTAAERTPALSALDYARLGQRADTQRRVVEEHRLAAAQAALEDGDAAA
jgi:hypothetical protein